MHKEVIFIDIDRDRDLLIQRLSKAIDTNDKETILKISEEVDGILSKLLTDDNKLTLSSKEPCRRREM
ncbi:MAG: hypothetical protein IMZ70_01590 [Candidatus Atribacteria bacterium]|nr:hypothetical protein [Candidatus Atribacteria bacterium]